MAPKIKLKKTLNCEEEFNQCFHQAQIREIRQK